MAIIQFHDVYVTSRSAVGGPVEAKGPLAEQFDKCYEDTYCGEDCFEKAERRLLYDASDIALRKAQLQVSDLDVLVGGDLLNQLMSSHYFAKDLHVPFIGMYAACATSSLVIGTAAMWIEHHMASHAMAFTSSHTAAAERQFRFPNEYGIQKKDTTTTTVCGAGAIVLGTKPSNIKVTAFVPGKIVDWNHTDANDMGLAMAPAAYDTLTTYLKESKQKITDFDRIVSGDLSQVGFAFLTDLLTQEQYEIDNRLSVCGLMIYDNSKQDVFCGGSGCACSMCVSMSDLLNRLEQGEYHRIMVLATGALLSPVAVQQKGTIPCIAHGIVYERSE